MFAANTVSAYCHDISSCSPCDSSQCRLLTFEMLLVWPSRTGRPQGFRMRLASASTAMAFLCGHCSCYCSLSLSLSLFLSLSLYLSLSLSLSVSLSVFSPVLLQLVGAVRAVLAVLAVSSIVGMRRLSTLVRGIKLTAASFLDQHSKCSSL